MMTMTSPPAAASKTSDRSLRAILIDLSQRRNWNEASGSMTRSDLLTLLESWSLKGRAWQVYPGLLAWPEPWRARPKWLLLGGRGAGKTRAGAEWVKGLVAAEPDAARKGLRRIALVGETFADAR